MATGQGTAIIDFGAFPGSNEASVVVSGQATISNTSKAEAWVMGDDSTTGTGAHSVSDHKYLPLFAAFTCGTPVTASDFTIYGRSTQKLQGKFALRWVWAD